MGTQGCQGGAGPGAGSVGSQTGAGSRTGVDCMGSRTGAGSGVESVCSQTGAGSGADCVGSRNGGDKKHKEDVQDPTRKHGAEHTINTKRGINETPESNGKHTKQSMSVTYCPPPIRASSHRRNNIGRDGWN